MWVSALRFHPNQLSPLSYTSRLITIYILVLLISVTFTSGQQRSYNHQVENRSPEIDPFWYVGRGVRPIGRFGKRQLKLSWNTRSAGSRIPDLILTALQEQEALEAEDAGW
ncbi:hypothetical protein JRQ81_018891 [Phrynocephalus forsythii]|uniref:PRRP protein n=1 Tax=Phrynocephalus forsythii TaxID=171643 RepID=A0A9Q0XRB6_9SAUR|nr:hypothetical protein JRQ81_018891 [Phrynocephalus forsythii]